MTNSSWQAISRAMARAWAAWAWLMQSIFGAWAWQAPGWMAWIRLRAAALGRRGSSLTRRHPRRAAAVLASILILGAGAHAAWRWYHMLPKPEYAGYSLA